MMYKTFTAKMLNIIIPVLIHSVFCVLNFMLPAKQSFPQHLCRPGLEYDDEG